MFDAELIPENVVGISLAKMRGEKLTLCEEVIFTGGRTAVETTLRRAELSGNVGPVGETGDFFADLLDENGDMVENIKLSRESWNALKNRWMPCKVASEE
jgi:hypothetical protein